MRILADVVDPVHKLAHTTVTQAMPFRWLSLWNKYDWAEDTETAAR